MFHDCCFVLTKVELSHHLFQRIYGGQIASAPDEGIVNDHITNIFAIAIPENYYDHDVPEILLRADGKDLLKENDNSLCNHFRISRYDIIDKLEIGKICQDLQVMVKAINEQFE